MIKITSKMTEAQTKLQTASSWSNRGISFESYRLQSESGPNYK